EQESDAVLDAVLDVVAECAERVDVVVLSGEGRRVDRRGEVEVEPLGARNEGGSESARDRDEGFGAAGDAVTDGPDRLREWVRGVEQHRVRVVGADGGERDDRAAVR